MKKIIQTKNICARGIEYDVDKQGRVRDVRFLGGCAGNSLGISALVEGLPVEEVIKKLRGIQCRFGTSCPDQLAAALAEEFGGGEGS